MYFFLGDFYYFVKKELVKNEERKILKKIKIRIRRKRNTELEEEKKIVFSLEKNPVF